MMELFGRRWPMLAGMFDAHADDVGHDIDAVFSWVDGADSAFLSSWAGWLVEMAGAGRGRDRIHGAPAFRPGAGGTLAQALSYTGFVSDVTANKVSMAGITSAGSVSGKLRDGSAYTSQIPVALNDNALPALLL